MADLERFILMGLIEEWNLITDFYEIDKEGRFFCPLFSLSESKSFLGQWDYSKYEIKIQRDFAIKESWENIKHVLKHEMAHQYADIVLNKDRSETPHGPSFKKACKILRINTKAEFDSSNGKKDISKRDSIIFKIKKLFSLATSSNKNEAELAMKKAHELMALYNFENIDLKSSVNLSKQIGRAGLKHFRESYYLASLLSEFYFVYPVWVPSFIKEKGKMGKVLEISGKEINIETAAYVFDYVNRYIDITWKQYKKGQKLTRYEKTHYSIGVIDGFSSKLRAESKYYEPEKSNLPVALKSDPGLKEYLKWYYPHLRKETKKGGIKKGLYEEGKKKGKELVISKGINEKKSGGKVFIKG